MYRTNSRGWVTPEWRKIPSYVTYVDVGVQVDLARRVTGAHIRQLVRETVEGHLLVRALAELGAMRSTLEGVAGASELILVGGLSRTQEMITAFLPTVVEGNATPESVEGGHLTEEDEGEEGNDREETSL